MAESESATEEAKEEAKVEAWNSDMPENTSIEDAVDKLLKSLTGFSAKFNLKQAMSVVDLKHRQEPQGTRFRQVFVSQGAGTIVVSLVESFKAVHGGNEQRKTLYSFSVSVSDVNAYRKLEHRFFGYSAQKNATEAAFLLDELDRTVQS